MIYGDAAAGTVANNVWLELDVTSGVTAGGFVNFVVQNTSSNSCLYDSRESSTNKPELVITTGSS